MGSAAKRSVSQGNWQYRQVAIWPSSTSSCTHGWSIRPHVQGTAGQRYCAAGQRFCALAATLARP